MLRNLSDSNSIAQQILAEIRDSTVQKDRHRFQFNLERLGTIMAYELSKTLVYKNLEAHTPLGTAPFAAITTPPVLITVMRAAIPYWIGFQKIFDRSETGFIGAYRKEGNEISIQVDYVALPETESKDVILIDPMLATGKSMVDSVNLIRKRGAYSSIYLASLIAAPEGIAYIKKHLGNDIPIWTFSVDRELNAQSYIVPGLGDAGDLCFGEKL